MMPPPVNILLDILSPSTCISCGKPVLSSDYHLCSSCAGNITFLDDCCPICSGILAGGTCRICGERKWYLDRNITIAEYQGVMKEILHHYKFNSMRRLYIPIGRLAVEAFKKNAPTVDLITNVPMTHKKRWKRGYNQAELIARFISKRTGIPYQAVLTEKKSSITQRELGLRERFINVLNRYDLLKGRCISEKNIMLVDDIFTTGATINECARILRTGGVRNIISLTIARSSIKRLEKKQFLS